MHTIHAIAAVAGKKRVIGKDNQMLWHISSDFKRFKKLTTGHPVIMGRKTYDSIGKALPGRTNIVITRGQRNYEDALVAHSIEEALELAKAQEGSEDIFILGGGTIYEATLPLADVLNLTIIHKEFEGDTFFPDYSEFTEKVFKEEHLDEEIPYTFLDLKRS